MNHKIGKSNFLLLIVIAFSPQQLQAQSSLKDRPNIILIMSDDMGYSDLGCYGSEIATPNLDKLAGDGLKYTHFYNQARCCPSRASLMTGLYPHQAGMGWMADVDHDLPGYRGRLNENCLTIAQVLKSSGYATYMIGKWHLIHSRNMKPESPKDNWPLQRGFDKFYGILTGASNYYDPATLCRNNTLISAFADPEYHPDNYYFTNAITDNAIKFIKDDNAKEPFFMYVAYTAAHWPMQAPENDIKPYEGRYDSGWEILREQRLQKMKKLGVIGKDVALSPLDTHPWSEEQHKKGMARRMETYSAMITIMDRGIGEIVKELKEKKIYDNTVIIFLEDNGGNAEDVYFGGPHGEVKTMAPDTSNLKPLPMEAVNYNMAPPITRDGKIAWQGLDVMAGPENIYSSYMKPWAQVSNTPFKEYKHFVHEGGIATPLIIHWAKGIKARGQIREQVGDEIDIMPTIVQLAGATYPLSYKGNSITPVAGISLVPSFDSDLLLTRKAIFWEHEMNRAVRMGKWKLVSTGELMDGNYGGWKYYDNRPWELYNMDEDRSELRDLSGQYPAKVKEMSSLWENWAKTHNVYPTPWKKLQPNIHTYYTTDEIKSNYKPDQKN